MDLNNNIAMLIHVVRTGNSLSKCLSTTKIDALVRHESSEVRLWTAKALINENNAQTVSWLCILSVDKNTEVRLEAVDSLSTFVCEQSYSALVSALRDSDELVRAFAAYGVALVGIHVAHESAKKILLEIEKCELSDRVKVGIYEGLYILGHKKSIEKLFRLCESTDYHVCCSAFRALSEIVNKSNREDIQLFVRSIDTSGMPNAVKDAIMQLNAQLIL